MRITCSVNPKQIENLYTYVSSSMKNARDTDKIFDAEVFMKNLFKNFQNKKDIDTAVKFLQPVPLMIVKAYTSIPNYITDVKLDINPLLELNTKFADELTGLRNVLNKFAPQQNQSVLKESIFKTSLEAVLPVSKNKSIEPIRFEPSDVFTTTLQQFTTLDPNKLDENLIQRSSEERSLFYNVINKIQEENSDENNGISKNITYQGQNLKLKTIKLSEIDSNLLDAVTANFLLRANSMLKAGTAKAQVIKPSEVILTVLANDKGEVLQFDSNGNLSNSGKIVYQMLRNVVIKNNKYAVVNLYGYVAFKSVIKRLEKDLEISTEEATALFQEQLKALYNLRKSILSGDVSLLNIVDFSKGIDSGYTQKDLKIKDLTKFGLKDSVRNITIVKVKGASEAIINLKGESFNINRPKLDLNTIEKIAEVLTNDKLNYELKKTYIQQFLSPWTASRSQRRHGIKYLDQNKIIQYFYFENTYEKNPGEKQKELDLTSPEAKEIIIDSLKNASSFKGNMYPVNTIYSSDNLNTDSFIDYNLETKSFKKSNTSYSDFLLSLDGGKIDLSTANKEAVFNQYMKIGLPSVVSKELTVAKEEAPSDIRRRKDELVDFIKDSKDNVTVQVTNISEGEFNGKPFKVLTFNTPVENGFIRDQDILKIRVSPENFNISIKEGDWVNLFVEDIVDNKEELYITNAIVAVVQSNGEVLGRVGETTYPAETSREELYKQQYKNRQTKPIEKKINEVTVDSNTNSPSKGGLAARFKLNRSGNLTADSGTSSQNKKAKDWWTNSELSKYLDLETAVNIVNSNAYGRFISYGSVLAGKYGTIQIAEKGSNVDIYHEAWHGFTQLFLSKKEKQALYKEVAKSLKNKDLSVLEIEELLAEDFRTYAKNPKAKAGSPKRNTFFRRILNWLKKVFGYGYANNVQDIKVVKEMFENLYYNKGLNNYQPSVDNIQWDLLERNIGIEELGTNRQALTRTESILVKDSMDSIVSEIVDEVTEDLQVSNSKKSNAAALQLVLEPEQKNVLYEVIKERLQKQLTETVTKKNTLSENFDKNEFEIENLNENIRILETTLNNYGDPKQGAIAFHIENSTYKILADTYIEDELVKDEEDSSEVQERYSDKKVGDKSLLEFAGKETLYMLKSLHSMKNNNTELNSLGFKKLADFRLTWNNVVRTIAGESDPQVMYDKLLNASDIYQPFKQLTSYKLPNPGVSSNSLYAFKATTSFWQDFNKTRVPYVQLTLFEDGTSKPNNASTDSNRIIRNFYNNFVADDVNPYTLLDPKSKITELNLNKVIEDFDKSGNLDVNKSLAFARAIGIYVDDIETIRNELKSANGQNYYGLNFLYKALKNVNDTIKTKTLSSEEVKELKSLVQDPVSALKNGISKNLTSSEVTSQYTQINRLAELQGRFGEAANIFGVQNAAGDIVYEYIENNTISTRTNKLNKVDDFKELIGSDMNPMNYLNPDINTFTSKSVLLRSLFSLNSYATQGKKIKDAQIELFLESGTTSEIGTGTNTSDLDGASKFIQQVHMMMLSGNQEFIRAASKKSAFGLKFIGAVRSKLGIPLNEKNSNLYIDINKFPNYRDTQNLINDEFMIGYLASEANRIHKFENDSSLENYTGFNTILPNGRTAGKSFTLFDDIITEDTKKEIYEIISDNKENFFDLETYLYNENVVLLMKLKNEINEYFNGLVTQTRILLSENEYVSSNLFDEIPDLKNSFTKEEILKLPYDEQQNLIKSNDLYKQKVLAAAYTYNAWIHNFETANLFEGDISQYDHEKEELSKRSPGTKSGGKTYRVDQAAQDFVNGYLQDTSYAKQTDKNLLRYDGTLNTAIMKDVKRSSEYLDEIEAGLRKFYSKTIKNKTRVDQLVLKDLSVYKDMEEADGQGYITFDTYRALKNLENDWSYEQEQLFQKLTKGLSITSQEITEFFPPYKLFYSGSIKQAKVSMTSMHKFSLLPLIPNVMTGDLTNLHNQMIKENIHYSLFKTGSKVSHISSNKEADVIYEDDVQKTLKDNIEFTKNTIYVEYLKNVTGVPKKFKGETIFSTQFRKMILKDLYDKGIIDDKNIGAKAAAEKYEELINTYSEILKEELLNTIGYEKIGDKYVGNITSFLNLVQRELGRKNLPEHQIKFVGENANKSLKTDLSYHFKAGDIEKMIVGLIEKKLIRQRLNGESLVQASSSMTNGMWQEAGLNKFTKPTKADIKKYIGTNNLPFYRTLSNGSTAAMKVAIALQGDFKNLLRLQDVAVYKVVDNQRILDEDASLANLNRLIKDEEWLDGNSGYNRKKVTLVGTRIPVGGINYMEFAEVYEFLPESAGNILIPPTEIVAKSGSDFDIDKLNIFFPNIEYDGTLVMSNVSVETVSKISKTLDEKSKQKAVLKTKKLAVQNDILFAMRDILALPSNYANLVKPNATYLLKEEIADKIAEKVSDYDRYKNIIIDTKFNKKGNKVISPTRTMEPGYNLQKFIENMIGKKVLGMVAIENALSVIINSVGGKMPKSYKFEVFVNGKYTATNTSYDMRLMLPHNKFDDGAISLSDITAKDGNNIGEIYNQLLNGFVDIEKDPWVFFVGANYEVAPVLLYLIKTGVPKEQAVRFVQNPFVREYAAQQRKMKSVYADKMGILPYMNGAPAPQKIKYDAAGIAIEKLAMEKNITPDVAYFSKKSNVMVYKAASNAGYYQAVTAKADKYLNEDKEFSEKDILNVIESSALTDKEDNDKALAMFLHFLEIEKQIKGLTSLKIQSNSDTTTSKNLQEVIIRDNNYSNLEDVSKLDKELIDALRNDSILKSFRIGDLIKDIITPVFEFRNNDKVTEYLQDKLSNIRATRDEKSLLITRFKDLILDYIYKNQQSNFINSDGEITDTPDSYMGLKVTSKKGLDKGVMINEIEAPGILYIDKDQIQIDYENGNYLNSAYTEKGLRPMKSNYMSSIIQYTKYVIAREYLRSIMPIEAISKTKEFKNAKNILKNKLSEEEANKQAYEYYLNKEALIDSFNNSMIMGTSKEFSYSQSVIDIINEFPNLKLKYDVTSQLYIPIQYGKGEQSNVKVLGLRNSKAVSNESELGDTYYENLVALADPTIKKVSDETDNLRISRIFSQLPLVSIYQSGIGGYNTQSMIDVLPYVNYLNMMNVASQKFTKKQMNKETFDFIFNKVYDSEKGFVKKDKFPYLIVTPKEYEDSIILEVPKIELPIKVIDNDTKGKKIINDEDVSLFKKYKNKGINPSEFFTSKTKFTEFYNNNTGKREGAPQSSIWILQTNNRYNLTDKETGEIYITNVDLNTGIQYLSPVQPTSEVDEFNPEIILGPDSVGFDTKFSEELSKKIETVLREKYPNIKLNFTNDPIGFDSSPDVFNQEMKTSQETTQKVIAELTAPLKKAASQFYAFSRKNKVAFLATMENAIKSDPYKYIQVAYGGRVTVDLSALGYLLYDTYSEEILDWSTQQELKRLAEGEKRGMDPNNPEYIKDIEIAKQADKDLEYLADLEIKRIKDTISGFDNGTKTKKDLFELFVTAQNYFAIGESMSPYIAKTYPGIQRKFNLKGKEGIYTYKFNNGKLDVVYEKVPSKQKERAGKDPVTGEKLYKNVTYYSSEEVTSSDDRWIDAQLALKDFKNNPERIKKAINKVALENLEKESLKQRLKTQFQTPEQKKADLAAGRITEFEMSWEHYYGTAPSSVIESGLSDLAGDILATNGITDGQRGLTSPTYFHNSNNLLERTKSEEYAKLKAKQDLVKYVLANKDEFTADDKDINTAGDIMAPVPGWFLNAVTAASSGKLFRDLNNSIAIGVLSMTATDQWDKVQEGLFTGYEAPFQKLADLTDLNSRLTNKLVYGSTTNVFSDLYLLNQTYKDKIIGQANIKAMTVLVDAVNQKQDTLPHEYAHHYIAYFRDNEIVQEGIRRFGGEEALVQAIGEQVVAQKGEALNWWKKFTKWLLNLLSDKQVLQILTDSFLTKRNLNTDFNTFGATQQTSEVEVVTYKGTKYSVDFNVGSGTITNLKTGKVLEGGVTSPVGQAVVDLAIAQQDSTQQTSDVETEFGPEGKPPIDRTDKSCGI